MPSRPVPLLPTLRSWHCRWRCCVFACFPFFASDYLLDVAFFFGIYALLGLSLNIVLGEVGLYDLGHAGFYAIGAYTTAILNTQLRHPRSAAPARERHRVGALRLPGDLPDHPSARGLPVHRDHRHGGDRAPGAHQQPAAGSRAGPTACTGIASPTLGFLAIDSSLGVLLPGLGGGGRVHHRAAPPAALPHRARVELHQGGRGCRAGNGHQRAVATSCWRSSLGAALAGVAGNLYATKLLVVSPGQLHLLGVLPDVQHRADRRHGVRARA